MKAVVEMKKRAGRNRQLTERDRELCGFLAVCRYLTREQIEKLIFPGRSKARSSTRLRQLASRMGGQAAVVRGDLGYASAEGWTTVWALTAEGFDIGSQLLNLKLARTPKHDVGPWFLKHEVMLNEVFLGLVPQDGKTPARVPRGFRWVLGEYFDLPFNDFVRNGTGVESRRLQPDAVLEDAAGRRRYFIEYESGSATVRDAKKSTSTMAKLDRYGTFFRAPAGNPFAGERETFYDRAFRDGWPAEVLFVAPSEARRDSIARVIAAREHSDKYKFAARALTLAESRRVLRCALYGSRPAAGQRSPGADGDVTGDNRSDGGVRTNRHRGAPPPRPCVGPRRAARQTREAATQFSMRAAQRAGGAESARCSARNYSRVARERTRAPARPGRVRSPR